MVFRFKESLLDMLQILLSVGKDSITSTGGKGPNHQAVKIALVSIIPTRSSYMKLSAISMEILQVSAFNPEKPG